MCSKCEDHFYSITDVLLFSCILPGIYGGNIYIYIYICAVCVYICADNLESCSNNFSLTTVRLAVSLHAILIKLHYS